MPTIIKSQEASFGNGKAAYQYEDLSAVTEALSPIMADVGLSFRWKTASTEKGVSVTCIISHRDGHSEETTLSAGLDTSGSKNPIQALGSAVTYLQRYTLKAAVGVAAAKDDDGHAATAPQAAAPQKMLVKDQRPAWAKLRDELAACLTIEDMRILWMSPDFQTDFKGLSDSWQAQLEKFKEEHKASLKKAPAASDPTDQFDRMEQERVP